jgi:hypothetical protein
MIFLELLPPAGVRFFLHIYFVIQSGMEALNNIFQPIKNLIDELHN